jgi:hypothetical protein
MMNHFFEAKAIVRNIAKWVRQPLRPLGVSFLILSVTLSSLGGGEFLWSLLTHQGPVKAEAAYTGKHIRTVEYVLGGGTDNTARASAVMTYVGSAWNATKGTAGTRNIILEGSGINVISAYLDTNYLISTAAVDVTDMSIVIDVEGATSQGADLLVDEDRSTLVTDSGAGDLSVYVRSAHNVTAAFQGQSDSQWNAGLSVVAGMQVNFSAAGNRVLSNAKLVITYEQDYSATAHTETKTVRFPLDSTNGSDAGTRTTACAASATCSFTYLADIPDAVADGDILNVFVEMKALVDGNVARTFTVGVRGGSASSTAFNPTEVLTDATAVNFTWALPVGSPDFQRNTQQTIDVLSGAGAGTVTALGGELVVTYRFATDAPEQTETIRYFMNQRTSAPGTTKNSAGTSTVSIANVGMRMKNIWLKANIAPTASHTFTMYGRVGTTTEKSTAYTVTAANPRAGDTPTMIRDLSSDVGNFYEATTTIAAYTQFSTGGTPPGVELYLTFTWAGDQGGAQTKTALFSGTHPTVVPLAAPRHNRPTPIRLPETVVKTYKSAYLESHVTHTDTGTIIVGTITLGVNAATTAITEAGDTESYHATFLHGIASSTFSEGNTISWKDRALELNLLHSMAEEVYFSNVIVVTYDAALSGNSDAPSEGKHIRTVEYLLGGGNDNTARGDNVQVFVGSSWNTTKGTAGTKNIVIEGSGIRVLSAFVDVSFFSVTGTTNVSDIVVTLDVEGSATAGTDAHIAEGKSTSPFNGSGLTGYVRATHDATALFGDQTDTEWNAGLSVVGSVQVDMNAATNRSLTLSKLVITYEQDYTLVPHTETKTVRFPLDSTNGTDTGTRQAQCAANATCGFSYLANIPDAAADGDILDVFFEVHAEVSSAVSSTLQLGVRGNTASSSAYAWTETNTDDTTYTVAWTPAVGSPNFQRNTAQFLDVLAGTVGLNALGGELVVTYRYSTAATEQTETVRYMMNQSSAAPGTTKNTAGTSTLSVANRGMNMKHIWFRAHTAPNAAGNYSISGKVGTATEKTRTIAIAGGVRAANSPTIIYDMSLDAGNFFATTTVAGYTQYSAGGAPSGVEVYLTFTWRGDLGGARTKTAIFSGTHPSVVPQANLNMNRPVTIQLPESVEKTFRDAYLENIVNHSDGTTIIIGTMTFGVNGSTTAVVETGDTESYTEVYLKRIASSTFSGGNTIAWDRRVFELGHSHSMAEEVYFSPTMVVTYDANLPLKIPVLTQNYYQFFVDNGALLPVDEWPVGAAALSENTDITASDLPPDSGERFRLRMSVGVSTTTLLASSTSFRLEYGAPTSTCADLSGTWSPVGAIGSGAIWRGFNTALSDGTNLSGNPPTLSDLLLSVSDRAGSFEESNNSTGTPFDVFVGEDIEYDWVVEHNGAATNTEYCFRMAHADGASFLNYALYPIVKTAGYSPETRNWRFYDDEVNETPTTPLANENVAAANIKYGDIQKLRITVSDTRGHNGVNQKFRLQYSTFSDFSAQVFFVGATTSCTTLWCYSNAVDLDDDPITALLLTDSVFAGRHNEAATTTSTIDPLANSAYEFEFTFAHNGAAANETYFFRLYDVNNDVPVPKDALASYPSVSTGDTTLSFEVAGYSTSTIAEGETTTFTTTPTEVPFGDLSVGVSQIGAHSLTVTTNAINGYQVLVGESQDFLSGSSEIPGVNASNTTPGAWASVCTAGMIGCFGYHSGDNTLFGGSTRFSVNDTWAEFEIPLREVMFASAPVASDTIDMLYRVERHPLLPAGSYQTSIRYIVVPSF